MARTQILHLSDLHVSQKDNFDRRVVLDPLIDRIRKDRKSGLVPEIVVVSGDLAFQGIAAEYATAEAFFTDLLGALDLPRERLFIVPGNHDVNRKKYRPTDIPRYETVQQLNEELGNPDFRAELLKGMTDYFHFAESFCPHLKPLDDRLVPFAVKYPSQGGKTIQIIGLNSAWMCRKSPDEKTIAIGDWQIRKAVGAADREGEVDLRLFLFHHPLQWLWPEDQKRCKSFIGNALVLCGHLHEPAGGFYHELDGAYHLFQAGGAYLGSESAWPSRYHYITLDWEKKSILLDFRSFDKRTGRWGLDGSTGDDGQAHFSMPGPSQAEETEGKVAPPAAIPEDYCRWIGGNCGTMEADKLYGKGDAFPLRLPEIFIPLYANDPESPARKADQMEAKQAPVDIEALVARHDFLLIEGQAGSGKTTLLKHVACALSGNDKTVVPPEGLEGYLPVLILLKHVDAFFRAEDRSERPSTTAKEALEWYFASQMEGLLSFKVLEPFLAAGKAIFLVDGLDEIRPAQRDAVVEALSNLVLRHGENRIILAGRPHGLEGAVIERYGSRRIKINPLSLDQINLFIQKWFAYLYPGRYSAGRRNAEAMIADIRSHPATGDLVDNPLMLTAVCILYHDNKELPDQRVELYKKFVDNLLYRRFTDPEQVHQYLATLAHRMHAERARAVDRVFALKVMREVYEKGPQENDQKYGQRLARVFDDLEPRCGLLRMEQGQYAFWHLTFQEFLAAVYMADNASDFVQAIEPLWSEDWYKEVVELFIGYLSITSRKAANSVVAAGTTAEDVAPFKRWRLAGRALVDIPKERREKPVIAGVVQRMVETFHVGADPAAIADAGEVLGRLGDPRDLQAFVPVHGGTYAFKERGRTKVEPFEIAKYPVTNAWFDTFIQAGAYERPDYWTTEGRKWLSHTGARQPRFWEERRWNCPNAPVVGVCWWEADAFCRWITITRKDGWSYCLPDENQWEAAAAGKEAREYPWGNGWKEGCCNTEESKIGRTSAVGVFKSGETPEGVADMAGNVWDWTASNYHSDRQLTDFRFEEEIQRLWEEADRTRDEKKIEEYFEKLREESRQLPILRGGSWGFDHEYARCACRFRDHPNGRDDDVGFRCARTRK